MCLQPPRKFQQARAVETALTHYINLLVARKYPEGNPKCSKYTFKLILIYSCIIFNCRKTVQKFKLSFTFKNPIFVWHSSSLTPIQLPGRVSLTVPPQVYPHCLPMTQWPTCLPACLQGGCPLRPKLQQNQTCNVSEFVYIKSYAPCIQGV